MAATIDWKNDSNWGGVLGWCNGVRSRMSNDPGIHDLHEQVKWQGHQWLDEYFEDILMGPAGGHSLIELTKTPARRKDAIKQGRTPMLASVKRMPTVLEVNKENVGAGGKPALSAFAQKLLQVKDEDISDRALQPVGNSPKRPSPTRPSVADIFDDAPRVPEPQRHPTSDRAKEEHDVEHMLSSSPQRPSSMASDQNLMPPERTGIDLSMISEREETTEAARSAPEFKPTKPEATHALHTEPYITPSTTAPELPAEVKAKDFVVPMDTDNTTHFHGAETDTTRNFMASQSSAGSDNTTRSFPRSTEKGFPVLKAPSPVKRESSAMPIARPTAGPAAPGRTSWLVKTVSKTPAVPLAKRKSDERDDSDDEDSDEARQVTKVMKTEQITNVKTEQQRDPSLRKTNSHHKLTKSLGPSAAAAKAAADAKAAAEARLAERAGGPSNGVTQAALDAAAMEDVKPRLSAEQEKERRLSVSDLVTRLEAKSRERSSRNDSMSTTPPDSPPPRPASRPLPVPPSVQDRPILIPPPCATTNILQPPPGLPNGPILRPHPSQVQQYEGTTTERSILFPPPKFVPKPSSASAKQPAPASGSGSGPGSSSSILLPAPAPAPFPLRMFLPISPSQSFLRKAPVPLSAQSTLISETSSIFDSQPVGGTQDTEWESQPSQQQPFDMRMVPDETHFWDKTQHRVPGGWDGENGMEEDERQRTAMEIDEDNDTDPWTRDALAQQHQDHPMEDIKLTPVPAPVPQPQPQPEQKKGGLFSTATSMISRALYGSASDALAAPAPASAEALPRAESVAKVVPPRAKTPASTSDDAPPPGKKQSKEKESSPVESSQPSILVKSVQAAQIAKKKEQEQQSKKATYISNMEARRLAHAQRKKEEEEVRAAELERKQREEIEKRKKEREAEEKRIRPVVKKAPSDDESNKKRKLEPAVKKTAATTKDAKKPESRPQSRIGKPNMGASTSSQVAGPPGSTFGKSQLRGPTPQPSVKLVAQPAPPLDLPMPPAFIPTPSQEMPPPAAPATSSGMIPTKNKFPQSATQGPARSLQELMQARVQAQIDAANGDPSPDDIELPEINSEYSDSEDEERVRTFDPPEWAQSPNLKRLLREQQKTDPDEVFGAIREIDMEDIFKSNKTRHSKFRVRSSSANWAGTDGLTAEEKEAYSIRMGYTATATLTKQNTM